MNVIFRRIIFWGFEAKAFTIVSTALCREIGNWKAQICFDRILAAYFWCFTLMTSFSFVGCKTALAADALIISLNQAPGTAGGSCQKLLEDFRGQDDWVVQGSFNATHFWGIIMSSNLMLKNVWELDITDPVKLGSWKITVTHKILKITKG